jgi:threonine/homoserine/homoserine lactone efflux protein
MFGIHDLGIFVISGILFNLAPGPDVMYVVHRSLSRGARGGAVAALGIGTGGFVHIAAAAIGLSAMLAASATAFTIIKLVGAAYLVFSGIRMLAAWKNKAADAAPDAGAALPDYRSVYVQGFLTNALNPKVAIFFLAFLPQFIDPASPDKAYAFACLGLLLNFTGTTCNLLLAVATARLAAGLGGTAKLGTYVTRGVGGLFILLGIKLAFAENS